jgi:hypothetical protein
MLQGGEAAVYRVRHMKHITNQSGQNAYFVLKSAARIVTTRL